MDKPLLTKPTNHLVSAFAVSWLGREYSNTHHLSFNFAVLKVETGLSLTKEKARTCCNYEIFDHDPQLDQNLKSIRNFSGQFFYTCLSIYGYSV